MDDALVYEGRDLEAMSFARNYHRWILDLFRPYLGSRLVEVGAGSGSFSEMLLALRPESLTLVEPSGMYRQLVEAAAAWETEARVATYNDTFDRVAARIRDDAHRVSLMSASSASSSAICSSTLT